MRRKWERGKTQTTYFGLMDGSNEPSFFLDTDATSSNYTCGFLIRTQLTSSLRAALPPHSAESLWLSVKSFP
jgi:hypothetical protein